MCRAGPRCRGGKYRGPASPGQPPYRTPSQPGSLVLNVLRQMLRCVRAQYRPRIQSRLHRGQDSDSGMLWQRGRDPGPRVHHQAIGLSAAVDLEDGAAHINPSGPARGGPSTSPQLSISAAMCAFLQTRAYYAAWRGAAQATPVGPNRQRPLPGSRQLVQASSRSRQRFRHAVAARQGSRPPRSSQGDRVVCRRGPRRWSRPYQSIWPVPRGSFYERAAGSWSSPCA